MNNARPKTHNIANKAKVCSPLQLFVYLDRESPAIPYWPCCQPLAGTIKDMPT